MVRQGWSLRRRLREPDVARIAGELAAFERAHDGIAIADLAARRVHEIGAALHLADQQASLNRCSVSGWSGALIVTTSQTLTMTSTVGW